MAESIPEPNSALEGGDNQVQAKVPFRGKKVAIAFVLSILVPGLGQFYAKRIWRGLAIAMSVTGFEFVGGKHHLLLSFVGMANFLLVGILFRFWIVADACYLAWKEDPRQVVRGNMRFLPVSVGVIIFLLTGYPTPQYVFKGYSHFRAFRVPSASMCPTICEGDRIVAQMDAYLKTAPQRGDLILIDFQSKHGPLFIKRVVGIGGDIVSEKDGAVLINGKTFVGVEPLHVCGGRKAAASPLSEALPRFEPVTVPAESFFVVGDNSANSLDSRFPEFGLVTSDQIRGKPLYIYWSHDRSRIGCTVR
jgi:signal peptidase I